MIITENFLDFGNKLGYPQGEMASGNSNWYSLAMKRSTCTCRSPKKVGIPTFFNENYQLSVCLYDDYYSVRQQNAENGLKVLPASMWPNLVLIALKVFILLTILMVKVFRPASIQPSQRSNSNSGQRINFFAIAHELLRVSDSFHTGWKPLVRPSKCFPNHCWKTFSKKLFKGH